MRAKLAGSLGESGYKALFSLLSVAGFVLLVYGFAKAPVVQVWSPPDWTRWVAVVLMLPAFVFLVAAYVPGRIKATVKHPFLVAIKIWALAHLIANGDLASIILFGSFLAYAVFDRITLEAAPADEPDRPRGSRAAAQRPHRRGARHGAVRRLSGVAASAPDRDRPSADLRKPGVAARFLHCKTPYISAIRPKGKTQGSRPKGLDPTV